MTQWDSNFQSLNQLLESKLPKMSKIEDTIGLNLNRTSDASRWNDLKKSNSK